MTGPVDTRAVREALARQPTPGGEPTEAQSAAVAAVLRDTAHGAEVLLIRRAQRDGDPWSGHMAFPGGRRDARDRDLYATALRETREEIDLDLEAHAELLGTLPSISAVARGRRVGMSVAPFVFALREDAPLTPNHEVEAVVWAALPAMLRGEGATTIPYVLEGRPLDLPAFDVAGNVVWGLTYRMLETLFEALAGAR